MKMNNFEKFTLIFTLSIIVFPSLVLFYLALFVLFLFMVLISALSNPLYLTIVKKEPLNLKTCKKSIQTYFRDYFFAVKPLFTQFLMTYKQWFEQIKEYFKNRRDNS